MKLKQLIVLGCLAGFLTSTPILAEGTWGTTDNQQTTDKTDKNVKAKESNKNGKKHKKRRGIKRHDQIKKESKESENGSKIAE